MIIALILFTMGIFTILGLYVYTYYRVSIMSKLRLWMNDFIHGYKRAGIPLWWTRFSKTYFAKFVRVVGSISVLIVRILMPQIPRLDHFINTHAFLLNFNWVIVLLFSRYLLILSFCNRWSSYKYFSTGMYKKFY